MNNILNKYRFFFVILWLNWINLINSAGITRDDIKNDNQNYNDPTFSEFAQNNFNFFLSFVRTEYYYSNIVVFLLVLMFFYTIITSERKRIRVIKNE